MNDLKPCPFCGLTDPLELWNGKPGCVDEFDAKGNENASSEHGLDVCVVCNFNHGGCGASGGFHLTPEGAEVMWNRRVKS